MEMFEQALPENWRPVIRLVLSIVSWIPDVQNALLTYAVYGNNPVVRGLKIVFLLLPFLLFIVGVWVTMLSVYTYLFRPRRNTYVSTVFIMWWDSIRSIWLFWVGAVQFLWLSIGWFWGMLRVIVGVMVDLFRQIVYYPFVFTKDLATRYFRPGVPWVAIIMTLFWILFEAMIFTYVLSPTIFEVLSNLVGIETHTFLSPMLFIFLSVLIGGSFACIYWLGEAVKKKDIVQIVSMLIWELCVVVVEILFLYRDLVDAITPWIAQQTGDQVQLGLTGTILIAGFAWVGIRAMTWFLFARYGIAVIIAIIARQELGHGTVADEAHEVKPINWIRHILDTFKSETEWFHDKGKEILESLALPALQIVAAGINFLMVFITSKPIFSLPFKKIEDVMETQELL
ncbi:MAG: hypothetical protein GF384_00320, partial [Elusimicrobia bacterium]|nr:hypothetical protein [Elusimicrobiota bacterium]MBD3411540.1 hypothetical protein [Elusimicrobiota bacterium]